MSFEKFGFRGEVTIERFNAQGVQETVTSTNKVVNEGLKYSAARWRDNNTNPIAYVGFGTNGAATTAVMTALTAETGARVPVTTSIVNKNITNDAVQYVATIPPGNPAGVVSIQEVGLFTASSGGTMVARNTPGVVTKNPEDGITITWKVWGEAL